MSALTSLARTPEPATGVTPATTAGPASPGRHNAGISAAPDSGTFDTLLARTADTLSSKVGGEPLPPETRLSTTARDASVTTPELPFSADRARARTTALEIAHLEPAHADARALAVSAKSSAVNTSTRTTTRQRHPAPRDNRASDLVSVPVPLPPSIAAPSAIESGIGSMKPPKVTGVPSASSILTSRGSTMKLARSTDGHATPMLTSTVKSDPRVGAQSVFNSKVPVQREQHRVEGAAPVHNDLPAVSTPRLHVASLDNLAPNAASVKTHALSAEFPHGSATALSQRELPGVASQLLKVISPFRQAPNGSQRVSISLHPTELGEVHVSVTIFNGETSVRLVASTPEGAAAIRSSMGDLESQLASNGQRAHVTFESGFLSGGQTGSDARQSTGGHTPQHASNPPQGAERSTITGLAVTPTTDAAIATTHLIDIRI